MGICSIWEFSFYFFITTFFLFFLLVSSYYIFRQVRGWSFEFIRNAQKESFLFVFFKNLAFFYFLPFIIWFSIFSKIIKIIQYRTVGILFSKYFPF